jgi:hypothetical protein
MRHTLEAKRTQQPTQEGMMSAQHTPGPWKAAPHLLGEGTWRVFVPKAADDDMHDAIADLEHWQSFGATEANARLIAAAPTLLEAVEETERILRPYVHGSDDEIERLYYKARAAIRAAKGESNGWSILRCEG